MAGEVTPTPSKAEMMTPKHGTWVMPLRAFFKMKYAWAVSCWSQMILEYFTRKVTVVWRRKKRWISASVTFFFFFWKAAFRLQTAAFGVYWHIWLLTARSYHPPCLESWGDEVGLPCWVPISWLFSSKFLIHSESSCSSCFDLSPWTLPSYNFSSDIQLICLFSHKGLITVHLCPPPFQSTFYFTPLGPPVTQPPMGSGVPLTPFIHQGKG